MEATREAARCASCGRPRERGERLCTLCGHLFRPGADAAPAADGREATRQAPTASAAPPAPPAPEAAVRAPRLDEGHRHLALGLGLALVAALVPLGGRMGWFFCALVHELGHTSASWLLGVPAFPALSLSQHAASFHSEQQPLLVLAIAAAVAFGASRLLPGSRGVALAGIAVGLHLTLALTGLRELVFLLAGHGAELAFAVLAFWRARTGGATGSGVERTLYAAVAWTLAGKNAALTAGLFASAAARAEYAESGSFGLQNDYLRLAESVPLPLACAAMTLAAAATLPAALAIARTGR